jgi:uncharacterized protein YndB with AHSA1/START domain
MPTPNTERRDIVLTRTVPHPREKVWRAFTQPEHIAKWWGPNGFTNTIHEMDVRVGGTWRFMMHGPDGTDYPNKIVYTEIREPEFLAYDHSDDVPAGEKPTHEFQATVTLEEVGGGTKVTLRLVPVTVEEHERMVKFGATEGGNQTLGRLEHYLQTNPSL